METKQDVLSIRWDTLKSQVRQRWGRITEGDLNQINGNMDELINILRRRYGYGKIQAEIEISNWLSGFENVPARKN